MIIRRCKQKEGFSIIEVIVAALIFSIAATGIIAMGANIRPQASVSEKELGAALYAMYVLQRLRSKVDASTWNTGNLREGTYNETFNIYTATYVIANDALSNGRTISLNVTWSDPTF